MPLVLRLLGRFDANSGGELTIPGVRAQILLARLAVAEGERFDRSTLCAMLWADRGEPQARASLRQLIFTLRPALAPFSEVLVAEGNAIWLDPGQVDLDVSNFDRLARSPDPSDHEAALTLYRGDLLDGLDLVPFDAEGYFQHVRHKLRDQALALATALVASHIQTGDWEAALRFARKGLTLDPYDSGLNAALVEALNATGRYRDAREADVAFRNRMQSELGLALPPQPVVMQPRPVNPAGGDPVEGRPIRVLRPPAPYRRLSTPFALGAGVLALVVAGFALGPWRSGGADTSNLDNADIPVAARLPTASLLAYDLFLQAEAQLATARDDAQLQTVIDLYRRATDLDPAFAQAQAGYARAAARLAQRRFDALAYGDPIRAEATDAAVRALQLDPTNVGVLIALSRLRAQDGAQDSALDLAQRAVTAQPDNAEAHAHLALVWSRRGDGLRARAELGRLQKIDPTPRPEWLLTFGEIAFADSRYDDALVDLILAWPSLPDDPVLLEHLAAVLALRGRFALANEVRDKLLALLPEANLHLLHGHYAVFLGLDQNLRLLEGLGRAGLPEWPFGFQGAESDRVTGTELAALTHSVTWTGHLHDGSAFSRTSDAAGQFTFETGSGRLKGQQALLNDKLCQVVDLPDPARSICGAIFRADSGQGESRYVFVTPGEVHYFLLKY